MPRILLFCALFAIVFASASLRPEELDSDILTEIEEDDDDVQMTIPSREEETTDRADLPEEEEGDEDDEGEEEEEDLAASDVQVEDEDGQLDQEESAESSASEEADEEEEATSACPSKGWGGPGLYCHERTLLYCHAPGAVGHTVESCVGACVAAPQGYADYCVGGKPLTYAEAIAKGTHHHHHHHNDNNTTTTAGSIHDPHFRPHRSLSRFRATPSLLRCVGASPSAAEAYAAALSATLDRFDMTNLDEIKSFLANAIVDSHYWESISSTHHHSHSHSHPHCHSISGGCKYRARGIFPLRHDHTYKAAGTFFSQPFLSHPDMISTQPEWAFETAGWMWNKVRHANRCFSKMSQKCQMKCAAGRISDSYVERSGRGEDEDVCGLHDPVEWRERQQMVENVDRCLGTVEGGTPKYSEALGGECGPNGEGKCGSISGLPSSGYWTGYCGSTDYYCLKPISGPHHGASRYDPCGPGGVGGTGACDSQASCENGYWTEYCAAGSSLVCCKPL